MIKEYAGEKSITIPKSHRWIILLAEFGGFYAYAFTCPNHLGETTTIPAKYIPYPSSDDDTFDYWPNAMGMARDFATDLDEMNPEYDHTEELKQRYIKHIKDYGPIMEFTWNDEAMPEEQGGEDA